MAVFRYAPPRFVATQGLGPPGNIPIGISTQGILVPVGLFGEALTGYVTGGSAPVTFYNAATMTILADYAPSGYEGYVTGSDVTFTVTLNGVLEANYKPSATVGYRFGGEALAFAPGIFTGTGGMVTDGSAPVTFSNAATGVDLYDYAPSLHEGYVTGGDALFVVERNGVICVDYKPFVETEDGYVSDGQAHITTNINGALTYCYFPDPRLEDGYVFGGAADVTATLLAEARGGKGVPRPRRRIEPQRQIWLYNAHAYFDATIQVGGEADCMFVPAKYTFIKSLPRIPSEELKQQPGEFQKFYNRFLLDKPKKTFTYEPEGTSNLSFGGGDEPTFFDFSEWIITLDDDYLIIDALATEENPFITTTFDRDRKVQIAREDEELLDILEIL